MSLPILIEQQYYAVVRHEGKLIIGSLETAGSKLAKSSLPTSKRSGNPAAAQAGTISRAERRTESLRNSSGIERGTDQPPALWRGRSTVSPHTLCSKRRGS